MSNKNSGLNIELGNSSSKIAYNWAKQTFNNRQGKMGAIGVKTDGGFSSLVTFGNERIGIASDGIGTKIELAERTRIYNTLGFDLVAMVADDLVTMGFEATNISNIIDVDFIDSDVIDQMMSGLAEACTFAGMSISGGEIAELGPRIAGYGDGMHFNWCSTAIGHLPAKLAEPIDGSALAPGQKVIALKSRGFRSNGFSLLRKIMVANFGDDWHTAAYDDNTTWGEKLLTPSLIYAPFITALIEQELQLKGIVHITGGGLFDNFSRLLKVNGVGADFDNIFEPFEVIRKVQELGNVSNEDAYLYWNMGNGMLIVADESEVNDILAKAKEMNYEAQVAGVITAEKMMRLKTPTVDMEQGY